jgi:hypothetical protein
MSFISDLVQETKDMFQNLRENPRDIFNGPGTLGALREALKYNDWKIRSINDPKKSSHDILLGGWSSGGENQRKAGRVVGSIAAAIAGGSALSGGEAAGAEGAATGAETGAGESFGLTGMEGAEAAGEGAQGVAGEFAGSEAGLGDQAWGVNPQGVEGTGADAALTGEAPTPSEAAFAETNTVDAGGANEFFGADASNTGTPVENWMEPGPASNAPVKEPGILERAMQWAGEKPINTAITYGAISQGASAALQSRAAERKRKEEEAAREYNATIRQRMKMGNPSVGGGGVNINMRPGTGVLRRPDGSVVYPPGIINRNMGGVRG